MPNPADRSARDKRYRQTHPDKRRRTGRRQAHRATVRGAAPFIACDGEGCGVDSLGRQHYMLFRMGDRELFTGSPLTTAELLGFITASDPGLFVGFAFGYDVTMILRDLPSERRARLLAPREAGAGKSRYVYFGNYGIEYLPKNYFRVCRLRRTAAGTLQVVPNSSRTIYEVFGFFQSKFTKALERFGIGGDDAEFIAGMKAEREDFTSMTDTVRRYCALECRYLAELMEAFRTACNGAGIHPRAWSGAGKLAEAMHKQHDTPTRADTEGLIPQAVRDMAGAAYYGGRFEVTRIGAIEGPIYESDICSAYPAAMRGLPCVIHGRWEKFGANVNRAKLAGAVYVAHAAFNHPTAPRLCGLPIRSKQGRICWPMQGRGTYWGCEIESAELLGAEVKLMGGWRFGCQCDCKPFDWVEPLYEYRKSLGKATAGYPIKLGINSLYGKLAQRVGNPRWANYVWAGLITAGTRAKLNYAISKAPDDILMLATDGVYSRVPLGLDEGLALGQWETAIHQRMFIVQPGLYWGPPKPKTRGVSLKYFETAISADDPRPRTMLLEDAWTAYGAAGCAGDLPGANVPVQSFTGLKLAQSRSKPETAGRWVVQDRRISFDWSTKRRESAAWRDGHVITQPLPGAADLVSMAYTGDGAKLAAVWDGLREELDDQPDYFDTSPPWKEG